MVDKPDKVRVGALELCDLPELEISQLNVRIDTGAKTSSLHVDNISEFEKNNRKWVSFDIHPDIHNVDRIVRRDAKVKGTRIVKSSNGGSEHRYVVDTLFQLGVHQWRIDLTLTDRSGMSYLMLLGRQAMENRIIVDPGEEFLLGNNSGSE
ncbi:ATP-dependent zinc protease [Dasania marina]|uniref:ATP-dependent zinc protease family protein n=1 Tax=Dasania marina TaxID=471499 RepID=UPI00037B465C|nr:RimK/LysX family protein [Dasania marina]